MTIEEWIPLLDPDEVSYVRRAFHLIKSGNGKPIEPPDGMSKVKANILWHHVLTLSEQTERKRKALSLIPLTFKLPYDLHKRLLEDAAFCDVNVSIFIRTCIQLSSETIKKNPTLINLLNSVIPR